MAVDAQRWTVGADASQVGVARCALSGYARAAGMGSSGVAAVALAVSEAVTNAVLHAFPDRSPGTIDLGASVAGDELEVVVWDDGVGMRERDDSPGAGFGLTLIRSSSSDVHLGSSPAGGVSVCMRFALA